MSWNDPLQAGKRLQMKTDDIEVIIRETSARSRKLPHFLLISGSSDLNDTEFNVISIAVGKSIEKARATAAKRQEVKDEIKAATFYAEQDEKYDMYFKSMGIKMDGDTGKVDVFAYITSETASRDVIDYTAILKIIGGRLIHVSPTNPEYLEEDEDGLKSLKANIELSVKTLKATLHLSDDESDNDDLNEWAGGGGMASCINFFQRHYPIYGKSAGNKYYLYYIFPKNEQFVYYSQLKINNNVMPCHRMLTFHNKKHGTVKYDMCVEYTWGATPMISNLQLKIIRLKNSSGELVVTDIAVVQGKTTYNEIYADVTGVHFNANYGLGL